MWFKNVWNKKLLWVKTNLGGKTKVGVENVWKQIVWGQIFWGVLKWNQGSYVLRKTAEPSIYGVCAQTLHCKKIDGSLDAPPVLSGLLSRYNRII